MSKAEQRALEAYPEECGKAFHSAFGTIEFDRNAAERQGYQKGFEQAEKDLALTWEDVQTIDNIIVDMAQHTDWPLKGQEAFYEEVLRRFNEKKGKK